MITVAKLDVKQPDGRTLRVHYAWSCKDLERLVLLALSTETQSASTRDTFVAVTIIRSEIVVDGHGIDG